MENDGKSDALSGDQSPLQKDRRICCCIEKGPTRRPALIFFEKVRALSAYFRDSGAATATVGVYRPWVSCAKHSE